MTKVERENLVALCKAIAERIAKQYVAQEKVQEIVTTESHDENVHDDRYYKKEEVIKAIADEIAKIVDGAPESLNTLREVADWITDDKTGAAAMAKSIAGKAEKASPALTGTATAENLTVSGILKIGDYTVSIV